MKKNKLIYINELGDIFLKNLFLKCFWWALRNKEFDFFNFQKGGGRCFFAIAPKTIYYKLNKQEKYLYNTNNFYF